MTVRETDKNQTATVFSPSFSSFQRLLIGVSWHLVYLLLETGNHDEASQHLELLLADSNRNEEALSILLEKMNIRRLIRIRLPCEVAATEADGECARSDRPRRTIRYVDRVSEDENHQAPGGCGRNGKLILDSLLMGGRRGPLVDGRNFFCWVVHRNGTSTYQQAALRLAPVDDFPLWADSRAPESRT